MRRTIAHVNNNRAHRAAPRALGAPLMDVSPEVVSMPIGIEISLPVEIEQEGSWYYASCDSLGVVSQGRSEDEAVSNFVEALGLFVESCYERDTLIEVMRDAGFRADSSVVGEIPATEGRMRQVKVPVGLIPQGHVAVA